MERHEELQARGTSEAMRQLENAVRHHEQRAKSKGSGHGPIAQLNRQLLSTHRPATDDEQTDCSECSGERWPCEPVANVIVRD